MKNCLIADSSSGIQKDDFEGIHFEEFNYSSVIPIDEWLGDFLTKFDHHFTNLFIPLSFGQTMSDFLGLRMALHIRCTATPTRYSNIFIYGSESVIQIIQNEFFDILKFPGIFLIDFSMDSIKKSFRIENRICNKDSLQEDLERIRLKVPMHLYDNHSVSNIWGMHRLLDIAGVDSTGVKSLASRRNNLRSIYFKWLLAKSDAKGLRNEHIEKTEEKYTASRLSGPKIIGKIDLPDSNKKRFK